MAEQEIPIAPPADSDEPIEVPKRDQKPKEPPVTFREFDVSSYIFSCRRSKGSSRHLLYFHFLNSANL